MTDQAVAGHEDTAHDVQRLKRNAVGTVGVIFMAVATAVVKATAVSIETAAQS